MAQAESVFSQLSRQLSELSTGKKISFGIFLVLGVVVVLAVVHFSSQPRFRVLYSDLPAQDVAAIVEKLKAQDWLVGTTAGYNIEHALYPEDLVAWLQETQDDKWKKLVAANGTKATEVLMDRLAQALEEKGTIYTLRRGFAIAGCGHIDLSEAEPEDKRKAIGELFIRIFEDEAKHVDGATFLAQGTLYPDVIESVSVRGPSATIKSHHNVGGLPEKLHLKIIEPLRMLFKDEVRKVGIALGISERLISRHPFPGPGLGIRILGDITPEKVRLLQEADAIYIRMLRESGLYDQVWQAGTILLPVQSVGVMGDERTYENAVALRAVTSLDGMTAEWSKLPYEFLADVSSAIINQVKGINRVVYDISTKPPATIEWE